MKSKYFGRKSSSSKYVQDSQWCTNLMTITYGPLAWRSIRALCPTFSNNFCHKIGNGNKVSFWRDVWNGQETLMRTYAAMFSLCSNAEATMAGYWSPQGWNICFVKVVMVARMLQHLRCFRDINVTLHAIIWKHDTDGKFSVNEFYKEIWNSQTVRQGDGGRFGKIRSQRKSCFSWLATRKSCQTHERLIRKGMQSASRCLLCREAEETNSHLLLHCKTPSQLWSIFFSLPQIFVNA